MQVAAACDGRSDCSTSGVAKCAILARHGNVTKTKAIKPVIPVLECFDDVYPIIGIVMRPQHRLSSEVRRRPS